MKLVQTLLKIICLAPTKSYLIIIDPSSHTTLGQVGISSKIAQNQSSGLYLPHFIWKVDQKLNQAMLVSVRTLLKITHLVSRKSYLVIVCPNSREKWTKSEIRSSWDSVRTLLKITHLAHGKSYLVIICPNSQENLTKKWNFVKLELVPTLLTITQVAHRKSYMVIVCPNSHEKLTKIKIMSSWSWFKHCSDLLTYPIGNHIW